MPSRHVYLPADFWGVAFTTKGSALPKIMLRSIVFTAPAILASLLRRDGYLGDGIGPTEDEQLTRFTLPEVPSRLITPFALLVALLTSYRLNHAHGKWEVANGSVMVIQETSRLLISRLCAIFPATALNKERLLRFRRLMVLACVSIYKHVHSDKDFDLELQRNLVTREELALFSRTSTISCEEGHHKSDKFPTKNRPALIFFWLHKELHSVFEAHNCAMTPVRVMLDQDLERLSSTFEKIELLNLTVLPVAYAQLTRLVCLAFLVLLPFAAHQTLEWKVVPLALVSNIIYFTVDLCASEMEAPFGDDDMDVDMPKMIRRMDKYTASLLSCFTDGPVENYNLYPESRSTDEGHHKLTKFGSMQNVYQLERRRRQRGGLLAQARSKRKEARKEKGREAVHGEAGTSSYAYKEPPSPWRSEAGSPLRSESAPDFPQHRNPKGSRVGFRRAPSARPTSPRRESIDRMPEVMAVGHAEIGSPVRSHSDLKTDLVPEVLAFPATPADQPDTPEDTPGGTALYQATTPHTMSGSGVSPSKDALYRATTSLEESSWMARDSASKSGSPPEGDAPDSMAEADSPPGAAAGEGSPISITPSEDIRLSPNLKKRLGLGPQQGAPVSLQHAQSASSDQIPLEDSAPPSVMPSSALPSSAPPWSSPAKPGPPPPPRRRLPRAASGPEVTGEVRMVASQLSPILGSPAAPQQPPLESETSQLPSVKARLRTDTAAGGPGVVTGVTVQVLEGGEDKEPHTTQGEASSQRDRDQPLPGKSAISDLGQEMPAREEFVSPATARWGEARSVAQKSYVIQRLALGPGPFAQHSPSSASLVDARSSSSSLAEASQPSRAQPATSNGPPALPSRRQPADADPPAVPFSRVSAALLSEMRAVESLKLLRSDTASSSFDGLSAIPKEEMQQLALARNAAAGPCAQHSPNSSPDSRALEALGRSSLAPSASSLAPRRRSSPTPGAKKPAGPPKKKPAKPPAKAPPKRPSKGPARDPGLPKSPRAMGHQMTATEGNQEDSEEDEDQGGGDFD